MWQFRWAEKLAREQHFMRSSVRNDTERAVPLEAGDESSSSYSKGGGGGGWSTDGRGGGGGVEY